MLIFAVNSKCILGKVVCTKAEEVAHLRKTVGNKGSSSGFNHNSNRGVCLVWNLFGIKLGFYNIYQFKALFYLVHTCDKREHNFEVAVNTGAVKGTQLGL